MCRSIKPLRAADWSASDEEVRAAALQYVRKVSGMRKPSRANQAAFETAVEQVALATRACLEQLGPRGETAAAGQTTNKLTSS
jgi:hypothetical protein